MPRKHKNAQNKNILYNRYSFTKICRLAGITPRQRIIMLRVINSKKKGGEDNE